MTDGDQTQAGNVGGCYVLCVNPDDKRDLAVLVSEDGIRWKRLNASKSASSAATQVASKQPAVSDGKAGITVRLNGRTYGLNLAAKPGQSYELQASTDLENWVVLKVFTGSGSEFHFDDPDAATIPHRFYRLRLLP